MTKRAFGKFQRRAQDAYDTPPKAVAPLLNHIQPGASFWEPCAGSGVLAAALEDAGLICDRQSDIEPRADHVEAADALAESAPAASYIITNPPWSRDALHPLITHFSEMRPTWLLFDADWMHTRQALPYLGKCAKIVSVGRVSWMGNGVSGFDNCAWYKFVPQAEAGKCEFYGWAA